LPDVPPVDIRLWKRAHARAPHRFPRWWLIGAGIVIGCGVGMLLVL
jgi:hypothetical protein